MILFQTGLRVSSIISDTEVRGLAVLMWKSGKMTTYLKTYLKLASVVLVGVFCSLLTLQSGPSLAATTSTYDDPSESKTATQPNFARPIGVLDDPVVQTPNLDRAGSSLEGYQTRVIQGWPVRINVELFASQKQKTEKAIELIDGQLKTLSKILPPEVLRSLRNVTIWLSPEYEGVRPTGEYHPSSAWLKKVGRRPELFRCVEFTNISIFEQECRRMPMLLLHELAHAYHDQVLEFDNPQIIAAYKRADESGIYNAILRSNGRTEKAYGMNDHKEYFAETSEALFGTNDFYPFDEPQLKKHDPEMYKLLRELWRLDVDPDTTINKSRSR